MFEFTGSNDQLESELAKLAAHVWAGTARFLLLLAEFDARQAWDGFNSTAHWLSWRCGLSPVAAREHVRVARALRALPLITAEFVAGRLSYSKVRALTRIATSASEELLLEWALHGTAAQLERVVRGVRLAKANEDPSRRFRRRSLTAYHDEDGSLVVKARLDPEDGAVFLRALEAAAVQVDAEGVPSESSNGRVPAETLVEEDPFDLDVSSPWERRRADALALMAESFLGSGTAGDQHADRALVVLHVDAESLSTGNGDRCALQDGPVLAAETARRIACDAGLIRIVEGSGPPSIGRKTRVVPRAMRRALRARDRGCRFPACNARRVDAHHIRHWAHGGDTAMSNLLLLCRRHHRLVHEGEFSLEENADGLVFRRRDGRQLVALAEPGSPATLVAENRHAGAAPGPHACEPISYTPKPDYGIAVEGLLTLEARRKSA
jgi:hypothetical protein